jgi:gas vesicle protein
MPEKFIFQGQTTFINRPRETVIQDFQNTYITGDGSESDKINAELLRLVELVLNSKAMPDETKEDTVQAIHSVAEQIKEEKANKLTLKGTLQAIQEVVSQVTDIAVPALAIISTVLKLLGLA